MWLLRPVVAHFTVAYYYYRIITSWKIPSTRRQQSPLAIYPSTALLEHWRHVGDVGCYTAVGVPWKHDHEAQNWWAQQRLRPMSNLEGRVLFRTYRLGHRGFSYGLRKRGAAGGDLSHKGCDEIFALVLNNKAVAIWEANALSHRYKIPAPWILIYEEDSYPTIFLKSNYFSGKSQGIKPAHNLRKTATSKTPFLG